MNALAPSAVAIGLALGVFLVVRRASGALTAPLPPLALGATAVVLLAWALGIRLLHRTPQSAARDTAGDLRSADALLTLWLPALTILLFAGACSYPGDRFIDWLVWPATLAGLFASFRWLRRAPCIAPAKLHAATPHEHILQQLTRFRTADGDDAVSGTLVAEFGRGQRETTLHVAFCPPFEHLPEITARIADDITSTVKVAQRLHNGAQFDVRLAEPAEESCPVAIEFLAAAPAAANRRLPPLAV